MLLKINQVDFSFASISKIKAPVEYSPLNIWPSQLHIEVYRDFNFP